MVQHSVTELFSLVWLLLWSAVSCVSEERFAMSKAERQSVKECVGKSRAGSTYQNLFYSDKLLTELVKDKRMADIAIATITED